MMYSHQSEGYDFLAESSFKFYQGRAFLNKQNQKENFFLPAGLRHSKTPAALFSVDL